jgi:[ribosomal protein S18]-alanine N-acetyltransferase
MKPRLQPRTAHPTRLDHASLAGACGLHPAQSGCPFFSIVGGKHEIPQRQHGDRTGYVDEQKAPHTLSRMLLLFLLMTIVRPGLRRSKGTIVSNLPIRKVGEKICGKVGGAILLLPKRTTLIPAPRPSAHRIYNDGVPSNVRDFQIRDYSPADFDALWRIDQTCFPPGISYSRTELKVYMRRRGSFTLIAERIPGKAPVEPASGKVGKNPQVASGDGEIAGFIVAESGYRGSGHIITIDVVAAARRFGVGSLLLNAAENRIRMAECHSVELETAVDNISALSFYKRHGYNVVRTFPRYYANGVDALVLQKELKAAS